MIEVSENIKTLYRWALKENRRFLMFENYHTNIYRICGLIRDINMEEGEAERQGPSFVTLKPMPPNI